MSEIINTNNTNTNTNIKNNKKYDDSKLEMSNPNNFKFLRKQLYRRKLKNYCYFRRRAESLFSCELMGFWNSIILMLIPTAILSYILISLMKKSLLTSKPNYIPILVIIYISFIFCVLLLSDVSLSDPGIQRGTPIYESTFNKNKIKKVIKGTKIDLKYCVTCHLIRDVRSFHCRFCGICVEKHDHHCGYVSNCIGLYNYKKFFYFLCFLCYYTWMVLGTSLHAFIKYGISIETSGLYFALPLVNCIFVGMFVFFTSYLVVQHIVIIVNNKTTREFIKNKDADLYNEGWRNNCKEAFCDKTYENYKDN